MRKLALITLVLFSLTLSSSAMIEVRASDPATSITITAIDDIMQVFDHKAKFVVTTTSATTGGTLHVALSVSGLPPSWTYTLSPSVFDLDPGESKTSTVEITGSVDTSPGSYPFTVTASYSIPWILISGPLGSLVPKVEAVSCSDEVYVLQTLVIPEYPLGTIMALAMCLAALGVFRAKRTSIRY